MKLKHLSCLAIVPTVFSSFAADQPTKKVDAETPNIIMIYTDDMGYGDLGCYGHPNIKTPHLDQMADEGIRFTSFYVAASVSTPSRAALLTGRYPIRHTPHNFGPKSTDGMPLTETTLAQIIKQQGYKTMAIGKWHLGHQPEYLPTSRGFDSFYGLPYSNDMILPFCPWLDESDKLFLYEDTSRVKEIGFEQDDLTKNYTEKAIEFIRQNKDNRFFLYLAHSMPHLPVSTSDEFKGKSDGGLYGDVIETIDWSAGEILSTLKKLNLDKNTIVVFASDNGPWHDLKERMLQRGVEPWHVGFTGGLRGSKATTYEGGHRVPAIVRWPGQIPEKQVCNEMVTIMDIFATFVHLADGELPEKLKVDGRNALPLMKGKDVKVRNKFFYVLGKNLQAVRVGDMKLRVTKKSGIQLFNLKVDPNERINIADRNPKTVEKLLKELKALSKETGADFDSTISK
jgi:arylsulfatase A